MATKSAIAVVVPMPVAPAPGLDARAVRDLLATVNHELRTPLTCIHGALGLLDMMAEASLSPKGRHVLEIARRNSERLLRLVDDLLERERDAAVEMDAVCDLATLMRRAGDVNEPYAAERGVRLELWDCPQAIVRGDEDRLLQVLTNLISNAAKFSPAGGSVTLAAFRHGDRMRIAVADLGPGIPAGFQGRVFTRFARARPGAGPGGTGLGLSIAKALVEAVGGSIGFETAAGIGTTFYVDLVECRS